MALKFLLGAGNFVGGLAAIGKHGVHSRLFAGKHFGRWGRVAAEGAEGAEHEAGWFGRAAGWVGRTLFSNLRMDATRGLLGGPARAAGSFLGRFGMTQGVGSLFGDLGRVAARAVGPISRVVAWIGEKGLIGILGRLGARAIPIVGELLLVADAFNFLRHHAKDIGKLVGEGIGFLIKNVPKWFRAGWPQIVGAFKDLVMSIVNLLNPANWVNAIKSFASGIAQGIKDAAADPKNGPPKPVRAGGHSALQKAHAVAGAGGVHVHVTANYHAPHGENDVAHRRNAVRHARQLAATTATTLAAAMRTTGTGLRIDLAGPSAFELMGGTA